MAFGASNNLVQETYIGVNAAECRRSSIHLC